jgi:hypothetical protein
MHEHALLATQCDGDRIHPVRGGGDLLRLLGRLLPGHRRLGLPNHDELQNCRARRGPTPTQILGGPKRSKKVPSRLWAHRTRIAIWSVRWGRSAGARCETRRRRASTACVRRVGCKTDMCSPPQPATLHAGVRHMIIKAETHEGPLRGHGTAGGVH